MNTDTAAFTPRAIYCERGLRSGDFVARVRDRAPHAHFLEYDDLPRLLADLESLPPGESKSSLVLATRSGGFVKPFPCGPGLVSPGWHYFIPAIGCPASCRYCFLHSYHPAGAPVVFANQKDMLAELESAILEDAAGYFYGGELCDNLMLEEYLGLVQPLINLFSRYPQAILELRTKSADVGPLLAAGSLPNVIVSWTMSPSSIVDKYEQGAATLSGRIRAAERAQGAGFRVGIRFDPIILEGGWRGEYESLVREMAASLDPRRVDSVQMGCMRFMPGLKAATQDSFGRSELYSSEFAVSLDGKYRYPRHVRIAAYVQIARLLRAWSNDLNPTLFMESESVAAGFAAAAAQKE
jgi:spore photoproduct lyase